MKKIRKIIISLLSLSLCLILFTSCNENIKDDNTVALVDGNSIDKNTFEKELSFYSSYYTKRYGDSYLETKNNKDKTNKEKLREDLLDSMIKDQVMLNDLISKKVEIDDNSASKLRNEIEKGLGEIGRAHV